ncbi:MAG TPA: general secretion pathway protein GspB [Burkholderiaceae bacterium]|nr:general secretion pathway protein GspB [Burkholderiaceae bacterium]
MSYILDALRKADAERERGHVPGIHAQPVFTGAAPVAARRGGPPWGWIAAGVLLLAVLGSLAWMGLGGTSAPVVVTAPPAPATTVTPPSTIAPVAIAPSVAPTAAPAPSAVRKVPIAAPPRATPRPDVPTAAAPIDSAAAAVAKAKPATPPSAPAAAPRIYAINELPDDVRRQLPAVAVGGSVYSGTPANRILIVNGQVLHEGEQAAPELVLRQIKLKGAVLEFRGYRYEIAY